MNVERKEGWQLRNINEVIAHEWQVQTVPQMAGTSHCKLLHRLFKATPLQAIGRRQAWPEPSPPLNEENVKLDMVSRLK